MTADFGLTRRGLLSGALIGGGALALSACGGTTQSTTTSPVQGAPKRGGAFRLGASDSTSSDTLEAALSDSTWTDLAIGHALYDMLTYHDPAQARINNLLAEEIEPAADLSYWTVRLRDAEFHDGRPVRAEDVIFTLTRALHPSLGSSAATLLASVDPKQLKKLDARTVRINLRYPDVSIPVGLANESSSIVPVGYDPMHPIGSGPFRLKSFAPGQLSVFERNDDYWQTGKPYLDELQIVGFADPGTTRVNALTSGQIDGADHLAFNLVPTVEGAVGHQLLVSRAYGYQTWEMRMDTPPFNDCPCASSHALNAGRPQIVDQAFAGSRFAASANDLPSYQDPLYDHSIPQRQQDIEQAKSLLKQAGRSGSTVELVVSSDLSQGAFETAQVLEQQATGTGMTIAVKNVPGAAYFAKYAAQAPLKFDYFATEAIWEHIGYSLLPGAPYNWSKWSDPQWLKLVTEARGTSDEAKQKELMAAAQRILSGARNPRHLRFH